MNNRKIAFHCFQFSERGTETATFDYAHYNELILKNESIIVCPDYAYGKGKTFEKFTQRFPVFKYNTKQELEALLKEQKVDILYLLKAGYNDGLYSTQTKTVIHAVFNHCEPHGHVYAYVSEWLAKTAGANKYPFVPHMVHLPQTQENMRDMLGIPNEAIVFGRYGGLHTFDIAFVKQAIYQILKKGNNIYFLFANTENFIQEKKYFSKRWKNTLVAPLIYRKDFFEKAIFLDAITEPIDKTKFINTCDAMLHARWEGETFGIACGEFSICNKPVITCNHPKVKDCSHIEILGEKGIYYHDKKSFINAINTFKKNSQIHYDVYSKKFSPEKVMETFKKVFIDD